MDGYHFLTNFACLNRKHTEEYGRFEGETKRLVIQRKCGHVLRQKQSCCRRDRTRDLILIIRLSFCLDDDQLDRSSFLKTEELARNVLECQSLFSFRWLLISFLFWQCTAENVSSAWCTTRTTADGSSLRLIRVPTAPHNTFAASLKPHISIHAHADKTSGTSLVSVAAVGLASISTKHHHNDKIKYLTIFVVIDSEVTKPSVQFGMSSFKKILLIFHPTCWIDLHY